MEVLHSGFHFLMISRQQDHSIIMEFPYKQCSFVKDTNDDDKNCKITFH